MGRNMLLEQRGYRYAEQENGHLSGMGDEPDEQDLDGIEDDVDFQNGYDAYHNELNRN
jgi:hypothetical protein